MKPILLDTFCKAGGCTKGYQRAGFRVVGVDIEPQPRYCGDEFFQGDAMEFIAKHGHEFDVIHASPPCQAYTSMRSLGKGAGRNAHDLVDVTRQALIDSGKTWVIENVPGAPLHRPIMLCGSMFGLRLRRHRLFECSRLLLGPSHCEHRPNPYAVYGDHPEDAFIHIGPVGPNATKRAPTLEAGRLAMGIDWMTWKELTQAIPPAYTEWIGKQLLSC